MAIQWDTLKKRSEELSLILSEPNVDNSKRHKLQKELSQLNAVLGKHDEIERLKVQLLSSQEQAQANRDAEMAELFKEEVSELQAKIAQEENALDLLMFPPDDIDTRSVFLEIRAGTGGQEAALFGSDLQRMYTNYALKKGWRVSVDSMSLTDLGGIRGSTYSLKVMPCMAT